MVKRPYRVFRFGGGTLALAVLACAVSAVHAGAAEPQRWVVVHWDFESVPTERLKICEYQCQPTDFETCARTLPRRGFELRASDEVFLVAHSNGAPNIERRLSVVVSVREPKADADIKSALSPLIGSQAPSLRGTETRTVTAVFPVFERLEPGGTVVMKFVRQERAAEKGSNWTELDASPDIVFDIRREAPRIVPSVGAMTVFSSDPSIAVARANAVVGATINDKPVQVYQPTIRVAEERRAWRPASVLFANIRMKGPLYGVIGVPVTKKFAEQPLLGFAWRLPVGRRSGLLIGVGAQAQRIAKLDGGFSADQILNPSAAITTTDIPVRRVWQTSPYLALSVHY